MTTTWLRRLAWSTGIVAVTVGGMAYVNANQPNAGVPDPIDLDAPGGSPVTTTHPDRAIELQQIPVEPAAPEIEETPTTVTAPPPATTPPPPASHAPRTVTDDDDADDDDHDDDDDD